jgi:hypothetical protein
MTSHISTHSKLPFPKSSINERGFRFSSAWSFLLYFSWLWPVAVQWVGATVLVLLCWWHCFGATVLVALCWCHCVDATVGGTVFVPLCWWHCVGAIVLVALFWCHCVGGIVLVPLCWCHCCGETYCLHLFQFFVEKQYVPWKPYTNNQTSRRHKVECYCDQ